jgi:hypothetical protein
MAPDARPVSAQRHHAVLVHPDVLVGLARFGQPAVDRRCALALRHLAAFGTTNTWKSTVGVNRGWRRTSLGNSHFYLWWRPAEGAAGQSRAPILVRAVRHHDETSDPLPVGPVLAYALRPFAEEGVEAVLPAPWTDEQHAFLDAPGRVRVLRGFPGSGKTTALWEAVRRTDAARPLHLTWSPQLAEQAGTWFGGTADVGFRAPGSEVVCWDFATFVGEILGIDVERVAHRTALGRFLVDLEACRLNRQALGPWFNTRENLFEELRAHVMGSQDVTLNGDRLLLDVDAWAVEAARRGLPTAALDGARLVADRLGLGQIDRAARWFPDLVAVAHARARLAVGGDGLRRSHDALVVDEVQDLTGLEIALVCDVVTAFEDRPVLILAGDEGQTVRSTGFDWGRLGDLLATRIDRPVTSELRRNLRSPAAIAAVVDRATRLYKDLDRRQRPRGAGEKGSGTGDDARVVLATATNAQEAGEVLAELAALSGMALVTAGEKRPDWVPEALADAILTPSDAKGLEYPCVVVLGIGDALRELDEYGPVNAIDASTRRMAVDRLRVALSRATATLSALEVAPSDVIVERLRELLGSDYVAAPELPGLAVVDERTFGEQVGALVAEARQLLAERPVRAWGRLDVATRLTRRHSEEADDDLHRELDAVRLELGWRLLLHEDRSADPVRPAATSVVRELAAAAGLSALRDAASALQRPLRGWRDPERAAWILALAVIPDLPDWLAATLRPHRQALLAGLRAERAVDAARLAMLPRGTLRAALMLLDVTDTEGHDEILLGAALRAREQGDAQTEVALLDQLAVPRSEWLADAFGRAGLPGLAVDTLASLGDTDATVRLARRLGLADRARALADGEAGPFLEALASVEEQLRAWTEAGAIEPLERARFVAAVEP